MILAHFTYKHKLNDYRHAPVIADTTSAPPSREPHNLFLKFKSIPSIMSSKTVEQYFLSYAPVLLAMNRAFFIPSCKIRKLGFNDVVLIIYLLKSIETNRMFKTDQSAKKNIQEPVFWGDRKR